MLIIVQGKNAEKHDPSRTPIADLRQYVFAAHDGVLLLVHVFICFGCFFGRVGVPLFRNGRTFAFCVTCRVSWVVGKMIYSGNVVSR